MGKYYSPFPNKNRFKIDKIQVNKMFAAFTDSCFLENRGFATSHPQPQGVHSSKKFGNH